MVMLTHGLCWRWLVWIQCSLTGKKERPACHFLQLNHFHYEATCFPRLLLANKS